MTILEAVIWGILQGLTEFIPISSSGHLVIIPPLFGMEGPSLIFSIFLHTGTLLAVIIFFWKDILNLFRRQRKVGILVLFATLPIFLTGSLFTDKIKVFFNYPQAVGWLLVINGLILLIGHLKLEKMHFRRNSPWRAFIIGVAQSFALLPGISRSGVTITAGIYTGLDRKEAYKFSFLLFIPASLLAFLYSFKDALYIKGAFNIYMLIGAIFSAIFGILALRVLYSLLMKAKLYLLGIYCINAGLLAVYLL